MAALGADETASIRVTVDPGPAGIEAGAREARYAALAQLAEHFGADVGAARAHPRRPGRDGAARPGPRLRRPVAAGDARATFRDRGDRAGSPGRCSDLTRAADRGGLPGRRHRVVGRTRTTTTRASPAPASGTRCCRCSSASSGPGSPRRSRARASSCARTWTSSSRSSSTAYDRARVRRRDRPGRRSTTPARRSAPACVRRAAIEAGAIASELTRAHVLAVLAPARHHGEKEIQLPGHVTAYADGEVLRFRPDQFRIVRDRIGRSDAGFDRPNVSDYPEFGRSEGGGEQARGWSRGRGRSRAGCR